MDQFEYINCPNCNKMYKIPVTNQVLKITCKNCDTIFYANLSESSSHIHIKKSLKIAFILIGIPLLFWIIIQFLSHTDSKNSRQILHVKSSNWVTIDYSGMVDKSIITHSGETVGQVIQKIPQYTDEIKGLVQQYLEPHSILCHDILLASTKPDTLPLINILSHYPEGSEQPAWVGLFREGHYQLYYNTNKIRLFLKGDNAKDCYDKYHSIIRHPINDIINSKNSSISYLEVYVFKNDYAKMEITLNTIPLVVDIKTLDLSPKLKPIDLNSIEEFLSKGVILEAVEVDYNNDLYFYGRASNSQTIAGHPLSLSDIAVIYRAIFHYGNNAPYISLDRNEDNRYAKVNFGGLLENTRIGEVVLEADKYFKTLSTGIDPNSHNVVKGKITRSVPNFYTEDERSILDDIGEGHTQIRYWFYPDSIGTVTDCNIGVILSHQFLADVERIDKKIHPSNAIRKTIQHLNLNYGKYEKAEETLQELNTVGRIMALINWLKGMSINNRIELDEFLSVKLPSHITPKKTKKMLAITAFAYPVYNKYSSNIGVDNPYLNLDYIRKNSKVYYISDILNKYNGSFSDEYFLGLAENYFSNLDINDIAPSDYIQLKNSLKLIEDQIKQKETTLDRYSSKEVNDFNKLIDKQNDLADKINNIHIETRCITSIGGGINLNPSEFKRISYLKNSPKIWEISKIKNRLQLVGQISKSGNWLRNNPTVYNSKPNTIPINNWSVSKSSNGVQKYIYNSNIGNNELSISQSKEGWTLVSNINNQKDRLKFFKDTNKFIISHYRMPREYTGTISQNGKRFQFY